MAIAREQVSFSYDGDNQGNDESDPKHSYPRPSSIWFPLVDYRTFVLIAAIGLVCMTIVLLVPSFHKATFGDDGTWSAKVTYWVDPVLVHVIGILSAAVIVLHRTGVGTAPRWKRVVFAILLPFALVVVAYALEMGVLKPTFAYETTSTHLRPSWFEGFLCSFGLSGSGSCPSGFFLRQAVLLLIGVVYLVRQPERENTERRYRIFELTALGILALSTIFIGYSRVYRGFHTMFDIAISAGVVCYAFWFFYYILALCLRRVLMNQTGGLTAATCIFLPVFLCYAGATHWVVLAGILIFCLIGFANIVGINEIEEGQA